MNSGSYAKKSLALLLIASLVAPLPALAQQQSSSPVTIGGATTPQPATTSADGKALIKAAQASEATIRVTRKAPDEYAVGNVGNGTIVIRTRYCHEYVRDEEAMMQTSEDGGENALLFATGAYCEVVGVTKANDRSYGLIDFLVDVGLMLLNRATGGVTPKPKPKRN